jgi:hypothetical protein
MTAATTTTARKTPAKPQDHLPKAEKPKVEKVDGGRKITLSGVTVTVSDAALDDFELLDDLRAVDVDKNTSRLPALLRRIVGDEYPDVMDALRDKDSGRVTISVAMAFIKDLFGALNPN